MFYFLKYLVEWQECNNHIKIQSKDYGLNTAGMFSEIQRSG